jgi:hypothetical protein
MLIGFRGHRDCSVYNPVHLSLGVHRLALTLWPHSPLDLTKVWLQASGNKHMIESIKKTYRTAGTRGLFDGISGMWLRQMSYSMCRFWAYDESKKLLGAGKDAPTWKLALTGSMGVCAYQQS